MRQLKSFIVFYLRVLPSYLFLRRTFRHPEDMQRKYLIRLLKYCQKHNEYFKEFLDFELNSLETTDILSKLPLLTKEIIRKEQKNIYSDEITNDYSKWANTGGSTGEPLRFPMLSFSNNSFESTNQLYLYLQMGWLFGETIVSVDGSRVPDSSIANNVFWIEGVNFPYGRYCLSTLYMENDNIIHYINFLNKVKPKIVRGYPSGVAKICSYAKMNNIDFEFSPKGVYLTSETITEEDKTLISETLHTIVWGQYGHTETSVFAISRPGSNEYKCSPYYGITEVLDQNGKHVNVGEEGEIVVTGFSHKGLPFIRYKTGDMAIYGGNENGWVVLKSLLGRSVDYIVNSQGIKIYLTGFIFGGHLRAFNYINDWQIKQTESGLVTIKIVQGNEWTSQYEEELVNLFKSKDIRIYIEYVSSIPRSKRGKRIFMLQNLK